jgi:hypothetical protein
MVCWMGGTMKIQYNFTRKELVLIAKTLNEVKLSNLDSETLEQVLRLKENLISLLNLESDLNEVER